MYYDGGMGKGNLLHENSDLGKWKYPKPNTTLERTIERVCNSWNFNFMYIVFTPDTEKFGECVVEAMKKG